MTHSHTSGLSGGQGEPSNPQRGEGCPRETQLGLWGYRAGALPPKRGMAELGFSESL